MTAVDIKPQRPVAANMSRAERAVTTRVVSSLDERQMVVAVRAAVFLGKPGWDYAHTFDPNDHCATHILAFVDREPAGTVRVRCFNNFARIERIAVLPEFRSLAVLNALARSALRLCRKKGYAQVSGLAYPHLVKFWSRHGGRVSGDAIPNELGLLVPMSMELQDWPDIKPFRSDEAGSRDFELQVFAWEGSSI